MEKVYTISFMDTEDPVTYGLGIGIIESISKQGGNIVLITKIKDGINIINVVAYKSCIEIDVERLT